MTGTRPTRSTNLQHELRSVYVSQHPMLPLLILATIFERNRKKQTELKENLA
jgi:hypothetical protein